MGVLIIAIAVITVFYIGFTIGQLTEINNTLKFLEELQNIRRSYEDGRGSD